MILNNILKNCTGHAVNAGRLFAVFMLVMAHMVQLSYGQFPEFPPDTVTRAMDRDQMMWQLGISFPDLVPKLEDPHAPANAWPADSANPEGNWTDAMHRTFTRSGFGLWNNYDDNKTGVYTPIDLLKMDDGMPISSPEQWWNLRRPEIFREVCEEVWGVIPPDSILSDVTFSTVESKGEAAGLVYIQKIITGNIDVSRYPQVRNVPRIQATLRIPAGKEDPVPVMVVFGMGRWTPIDRYWEICSVHGWGACIFDCTALQPDNGVGLTSYIIGLCNKGNWRKPTDWGSLAAWSWGVSKLIDYFETDPDVDATKVGVTGHSRFGKATLVTMAYEPRVAIAFPSCSGSLGVKMNRRHWGQDLENSAWEYEYHWTAGNFFKWMGPLYDTSYLPRKCELMPVDAHSLLSLCAPRPIFVNGGVNDTWTDAYGMYLACVAASPVYELLGKKGIIMKDPKPQVDVAYISGDIGYRYHKEGHIDIPDWPAFFEFASKYIKE
jgi:hypothetical protein